MQDVVYPILVVFLYSNLHFPKPRFFVFSFERRNFDVTATELAEIINLEFHDFEKILIVPDEAYRHVLQIPNFTRGFKEVVPSSLLPLKVNFIRKIVTLIIRPNSSSTDDVSRYGGIFSPSSDSRLLI